MAYRSKTIRRMPPKTRKLARLIGDLDSVSRRLKNMLPEIQTAEMFERAEAKRKAQQKHHPSQGGDLDLG